MEIFDEFEIGIKGLFGFFNFEFLFNIDFLEFFLFGLESFLVLFDDFLVVGVFFLYVWLVLLSVGLKKFLRVTGGRSVLFLFLGLIEVIFFIMSCLI